MQVIDYNGTRISFPDGVPVETIRSVLKAYHAKLKYADIAETEAIKKELRGSPWDTDEARSFLASLEAIKASLSEIARKEDTEYTGEFRGVIDAVNGCTDAIKAVEKVIPKPARDPLKTPEFARLIKLLTTISEQESPGNDDVVAVMADCRTYLHTLANKEEKEVVAQEQPLITGFDIIRGQNGKAESVELRY